MLTLSPALVIAIDRLLSGNIDHVTWVKSFVIVAITSFCVSLGYCLQSLSQKNNHQLPIQKQVSTPYQSLNLIGIGLVVGQFLIEFASLMLTDQSLLAWIGLTTLSINLILSPLINGEKSGPSDCLITVTIMAGILLCICSGPDHTFPLLSSDQIMNVLHTPTFHIVIIATSSWTFALLYLTMILDPADVWVGIMASLSRSQRYDLHRLCLSALAGSLAGLTMISARLSVAFIAHDHDHQFGLVGSWVVILSTISLILANIATMNHAVGLYENLYTIPTKSVFEVMVGIGGEIVFYKDSITLSYSQIAVLALGVLLCVSGLLMMHFVSDRLLAFQGLADKSVDFHEKQRLIRHNSQI